ncbi:MAG: hypothetical protein JXD19_10090 [Deltaproteobacteria bacterium]|nr:hypothetical protein [Deltaproteobacteria bacterium]
MKVAVIVPGEIPAEVKKPIEDELKRVASPGTDVEVFGIKGGRIRVAGDIDLSIPAAMEQAVNAEKNGFAAIILNGT